MFKHLALGVLLLAPSAANASEWVFLGASENVAFYVDTSTIKTSGNNRATWTKQVFKVPEKGVKELIEQFNFNCYQSTLSPLSTIHYGIDRRVVYSHTWPSYAQTVEPWGPDTFAEGLGKIACGLRRGSPVFDPSADAAFRFAQNR